MSDSNKKIIQPTGFNNVVLEQQNVIDKPDIEIIKEYEKFIGKFVENFKGAYYRYASLLPYTQTNFDAESFIPSSTNSNIQNTIRRDVGANMIGFMNVAPSYVENVKQFRVDVMSDNAPFLANQINLNYPDEVSGNEQLEAQMDLWKSQITFASFTYLDNDGNQTKSDSLQSIYAKALGDGTTTYSVFDINLSDTTNTSNVCKYAPKDSTNYNDSLLEAVAQFNSFYWKITKNPNKWSLAKDVAPTNAQYVATMKNPIMVCRKELLEYLKAENYAIYKNFEEFMKIGALEIIPETIFNTEPNGSFVATLSDMDIIANLSTSQILIYDKDAFIQFQYPVINEVKQSFINNITTSKYKHICVWNHYKKNAGCAIYDFGTSINTLALPTSDINK